MHGSLTHRDQLLHSAARLEARRAPQRKGKPGERKHLDPLRTPGTSLPKAGGKAVKVALGLGPQHVAIAPKLLPVSFDPVLLDLRAALSDDLEARGMAPQAPVRSWALELAAALRRRALDDANKSWTGTGHSAVRILRPGVSREGQRPPRSDIGLGTASQTQSSIASQTFAAAAGTGAAVVPLNQQQLSPHAANLFQGTPPPSRPTTNETTSRVLTPFDCRYDATAYSEILASLISSFDEKTLSNEYGQWHRLMHRLVPLVHVQDETTGLLLEATRTRLQELYALLRRAYREGLNTCRELITHVAAARQAENAAKHIASEVPELADEITRLKKRVAEIQARAIAHNVHVSTTHKLDSGGVMSGAMRERILELERQTRKYQFESEAHDSLSVAMEHDLDEAHACEAAAIRRVSTSEVALDDARILIKALHDQTVTMMRRIRELMEDKEEAKQDKEAAELQLTSTQAGFTTRVKVLQEQRSRLARQVIALGSVPCCGFDAKGNDLEDVWDAVKAASEHEKQQAVWAAERELSSALLNSMFLNLDDFLIKSVPVQTDAPAHSDSAVASLGPDAGELNPLTGGAMSNHIHIEDISDHHQIRGDAETCRELKRGDGNSLNLLPLGQISPKDTIAHMAVVSHLADIVFHDPLRQAKWVEANESGSRGGSNVLMQDEHEDLVGAMKAVHDKEKARLHNAMLMAQTKLAFFHASPHPDGTGNSDLIKSLRRDNESLLGQLGGVNQSDSELRREIDRLQNLVELAFNDDPAFRITMKAARGKTKGAETGDESSTVGKGEGGEAGEDGVDGGDSVEQHCPTCCCFNGDGVDGLTTKQRAARDRAKKSKAEKDRLYWQDQQGSIPPGLANDAAVKIQAAARGHLARLTWTARSDLLQQQEAATKIQAMTRGRNSRRSEMERRAKMGSVEHLTVAQHLKEDAMMSKRPCRLVGTNPGLHLLTHFEKFIGDVEAAKLGVELSSVAKGKAMPLLQVEQLIGELLQSKVKGDELHDRAGNQREVLQDCVVQYFLAKFGVKTLAIQRLVKLLDGLRLHYFDSRRVRVFVDSLCMGATVCDLLVTALKLARGGAATQTIAHDWGQGADHYMISAEQLLGCTFNEDGIIVHRQRISKNGDASNTGKVSNPAFHSQAIRSSIQKTKVVGRALVRMQTKGGKPESPGEASGGHKDGPSSLLQPSPPKSAGGSTTRGSRVDENVQLNSRFEMVNSMPLMDELIRLRASPRSRIIVEPDGGRERIFEVFRSALFSDVDGKQPANDPGCAESGRGYISLPLFLHLVVGQWAEAEMNLEFQLKEVFHDHAELHDYGRNHVNLANFKTLVELVHNDPDHEDTDWYISNVFHHMCTSNPDAEKEDSHFGLEQWLDVSHKLHIGLPVLADQHTLLLEERMDQLLTLKETLKQQRDEAVAAGHNLDGLQEYDLDIITPYGVPYNPWHGPDTKSDADHGADITALVDSKYYYEGADLGMDGSTQGGNNHHHHEKGGNHHHHQEVQGVDVNLNQHARIDTGRHVVKSKPKKEKKHEEKAKKHEKQEEHEVQHEVHDVQIKFQGKKT